MLSSEVFLMFLNKKIKERDLWFIIFSEEGSNRENIMV